MIICILCVACNNEYSEHSSESAAVIEKNVIAIDISSQPQQNEYTCHYSDVAKIESICNYIRDLTWDDLTTQKPDTEKGIEYTVTYTNEDNTTKTYYFKEPNYFKTDNFDWKLVNSLEDFKEIAANTTSN